ncbi:MAG: bifunctional DNA-formamidopyrimidine glycosylase/DNA-(apurinic or apyrimidinic site) lyase, partial [Candidatus Colwellbacteria bacterium]|nr:bifunctional DNA-formamidopyrimidine glycosylase/DNA-(apurinic or apyrimidinic site) lyase [Candidatus Colwellbacteria bacterium]
RGRVIKDTWWDWPKIIKKPSPDVFKKEIKGLKITDVKRRGKNILIYLSRDYVLLIHQKLTGHLLVGKWQVKKVAGSKHQVVSTIKGLLEERVNDYIRFILYLDNGQMVGLSDLRRFAKVLLVKKDELNKLPDIALLGPEPLDPKFTFAEFKKRIGARKRPIKQVLMDQAVLVGIGNIYSDDILWLAKVHPLRRAGDLGEAELRKIWRATKSVLNKAIKLRGTSTADYRDTAGKPGKYGREILAYRLTGKPCQRCKTLIKRLRVGGRSAHFCPKCQSI